MIMNLIALGLMLAIGYVWSSRGFFNALMNLAVVVTSGAIAFGLWETVAGMFAKISNEGIIQDIMWGASLLCTFVVALAALSLLVNVTVRAHMKPAVALDWIGGAVCGVGAGFISTGIIIISISQMRVAPDFLGYQPINFDTGGSLVRDQGLWLPIDRMTASFYGYTSERSFATYEPLSKWRPQVADEGHLLRVSEEEAQPRYSLRPEDVSFAGRYTVSAKGDKAADLVGDPKPIKTLDGDNITGSASVEGFLVLFKAGAKEKGGQVIVGANSATLVLRSPDDEESITLQPIACISQAKGDSLDLGRWRFDARNVFIGSVGGAAESLFSFEFLVPKRGDGDWQPIALYVRGVRFNLLDDNEQTVKPVVAYDNSAARESDRENRSIFGKVSSGATVISGDGQIIKIDSKALGGSIRVGKQLPENTVIDGSMVSGIELKDGNQIIGCNNLILRTSDLATTAVDKSLRIDSFVPGEGTAIVTIDVSNTSDFSMLAGESANATGAPAVIDSLGQRYDAIGYFYKDRSEVRLRFTPGTPLTALTDAPSISRSRDDQKLYIIYRVSANVKLKQYVIGSTAIKTFQPEINVEAQR